MGEPLFLLQIVENDSNRKVVSMPAGGALETELVDLCAQTVRDSLKDVLVPRCIEAIMSRKVGMFRTKAQVEQAVREELQTIVPFEVSKGIREGLKKVLWDMKTQTKFVVGVK